MRTIRKLTNQDKKVYIILKNKAIQLRFISDAAREGITYTGGKNLLECHIEDIVSLHPDGTICNLGWAGRMQYHNLKDAIYVDYEKYIDGCENCIIE